MATIMDISLFIQLQAIPQDLVSATLPMILVSMSLPKSTILILSYNLELIPIQSYYCVQFNQTQVLPLFLRLIFHSVNSDAIINISAITTQSILLSYPQSRQSTPLVIKQSPI